MTEYVGRGDPRRSMDLLWGRFEPPTKGRKQGLKLDDLVATAVEIADAEGLEAISMRKVGERLDRSAMSLYTYVPSKAELFDLMFERVLGELPTDFDRSGGWRQAAIEWAAAGWAFYERHPWVLQVSGARALLSPNEFAQFEAGLRIFDDLGLTGVEMMRAVNAVSSFVRGAAKALADVNAAERATGVSDDDWWTTRSALLEEVSEAAGDEWALRYPTITKLGAEQAFDQLDRPDDDVGYLQQDAIDTFTFGLARLLDGLDALIATKKKRKRS